MIYEQLWSVAVRKDIKKCHMVSGTVHPSMIRSKVKKIFFYK